MPPPRNYIAFDIEIANPIPVGSADWKAVRPLGITCAATLTSDGTLSLWYGKDSTGSPAKRMTSSEACVLLTHLENAVDNGYAILTWNGLGFDFDILAEETCEKERCRTLALKHIDMMFHIFCLKGFGLGLDKAAQGMNVPGKTAGMSGELAPGLWRQGEYQKVLDYVAQDVHTTLSVAQAVDLRGALTWTSESRKSQFLPIKKWLPVEDALKLPLPDVSWMRNPWQRSKFTGWTE